MGFLSQKVCLAGLASLRPDTFLRDFDFCKWHKAEVFGAAAILSAF